ncbi:MAG: hypothetical protein HKO53_14540 [Gemmatimonadetes bacterium]|nr:hypothetical protein [Gemmatimonadota bacterium]
MSRRPVRIGAHVLSALLLALAVGCGGAGGADPQEPEPAQSVAAPTPPPADPADVSSPEAIVRAVYDVISGEQGEARDWDRWHSLFFPGATLHPVGAAGEGWTAASMTPADFVQSADSSFVADGFYEVEIGDVTEVYGNIAHRFSSYASFRSSAETEPFNRGINSFQLLNDGERWWVLSILWQHEFQGGPIPDGYLYEP